MIVVCGDFHGKFKQVTKFISDSPEITTILQCGDFGFWPRFFNPSWYGYVSTPYRFDNNTLQNNNVKIYWCDGNHEDHDSIKKIENNEVIPNVFYMKRGSVLTLEDGRKILFIGGAYSIDKDYRTPGRDWFPEETISQQDIYNLPEEKIDIVISHTAPIEFKIPDYHEDFYRDPSRYALSLVLEKYQPKLWYFGHMHCFKEGYNNNCKWTCLSAIGFEDKWYTPLEEK